MGENVNFIIKAGRLERFEVVTAPTTENRTPQGKFPRESRVRIARVEMGVLIMRGGRD